jgi:hypothetical protein
MDQLHLRNHESRSSAACILCLSPFWIMAGKLALSEIRVSGQIVFCGIAERIPVFVARQRS